MTTKPPSWNQIRTNARKFAAEWKGATSEQSDAQTYMAEFLAIFGVERKRVAVFEQHAKRTSTAGDGRIDLFWPGTLVWEHKSAGKSLDDAEAQALDYLDDLDQANSPEVVVTSDFQSIRILDLTADAPKAHTIALADLPKEIDRFGFVVGYKRRTLATPQTEAEASVKAADLLGKVYEHLAADNYDDHFASILLARLLFLLFGDDTGMWQRNLLTELIETRTSADGSDLGSQLVALFSVLDTPEDKRSKSLDEVLARFPYVNGGLFKERIDVPFLSPGARRELLECCQFDWSRISPAIFGSLFQSVKSKEQRRELGEHYTSEANILKLIGPLFLDELLDRFDHAQNSEKSLSSLRGDISKMTFLDPACGCGNFLVVTYRELRRLDMRIQKRLVELGETQGAAVLDVDVTLSLSVSPTQFHGIEVEEWPSRIASTALFLTDQQANIELAREFGIAPDRLPITDDNTARIHNKDALAVEWADLVGVPSESVIILGNPPFNGARTLTPEGRASMEHVWGRQLNGNFDFVTAWYKKAVDYFGSTKGRWGFVSTNSICQGEPVADLWQPILDAGWRCRFAHRSFQWDSEAPGKAAVHVSIVGFDKQKTSPKPRLWAYPENARGGSTLHEVTNINPYLADGPNVLVRKRSAPFSSLMPPVTFGSMANDGGGLMVSPAEKELIGAGAAKYLRRFVGAKELVNDVDRWCLWLTDAKGSDIANDQFLKARVAFVREQRLESKRKTTRELAATPHLFGEIRQPTKPYLAIPRHVGVDRRYFPCKSFGPDVICGDANFLAADPDGFLFGVLSSAMFIAWMKAVGGRIKSDVRFSGTFTYNTFPLGDITPKSREAVVAAGQGVIAARSAHPGMSLADLYNPLGMPADLVKAHQTLDRVMDRAFGTSARLETTDDRQRVLFRAYARLTGQEVLV